MNKFYAFLIGAGVVCLIWYYSTKPDYNLDLGFNQFVGLYIIGSLIIIGLALAIIKLAEREIKK